MGLAVAALLGFVFEGVWYRKYVVQNGRLRRAVERAVDVAAPSIWTTCPIRHSTTAKKIFDPKWVCGQPRRNVSIDTEQHWSA